MPSEEAVNTAAAHAETAAKGAANGCMYVLGKLWAGLTACCGIFSRQVKKLSVTTVTVILRVLNIVNAALLGLACYYAFQMISGSVTRTFLATYIGLFALLLVLFETRVKYTEDAIRRLFGFMFSYMGRTVFLIFLGAICFGMLDDSYKDTIPYTVCLCVGLATLGNALFNCFIICSHPGFQAANRDAALAAAGVPTAGKADPSGLSDAQIRAYLEAHPEVAAAAIGGGAIKATPGQPAASPHVPEWGAPGAAAPAPAAKSGGGRFGGVFGGGGKKGKDVEAGGGGLAGGAGGGGYGSSAGAGYTPPQVPAAAAAVPTPSPKAAAAGELPGGNDPFASPNAAFGYAPPTGTIGGAAGSSGSGGHAHHTLKVTSAVPPAAAAPAAPAAQAASMVASTPEEDNPFATANPFDGQ